MRERDEQVVITLTCGLLEIACKVDKGSICRAMGWTPADWDANEKAGRKYDFYDLPPDLKMRIATEILDEYSYGELSDDVRSLILKEFKETVDTIEGIEDPNKYHPKEGS